MIGGNLLATRRSRLTAFFFLYLTEGMPLGFTATAIATQMRKQGVEPDAIGIFVATLYIPWAWKWIAGPIVDLVYSNRLGRRRAWIVSMQILMTIMLAVAMPVNFATQIGLFTILIMIHNVFGAIQDVAIDALACGVLKPEERGLANGLMFAGAYTGQAAGGAGVLFLSDYLTGYGVPFQYTFFFPIACILLVTLLVALRLREVPTADSTETAGPRLRAVAGQLNGYIRETLRAFFGSRLAVFGLCFALLPCGAQALGLALQSNLAVELGMGDSEIGLLALVSAIISAVGCVVGGYLSDRFGRRRMLAIYVACTALPSLILAYLMYRHGWIMPVDMKMTDRPVPPDVLLTGFWVVNIVFSVFQGLYYGTRTALLMDICTPSVAATQFTAYMAVLNLVISYSAFWQGKAIVTWGYPTTLVIDACFGLACLAFLPLMRKKEPPAGAASEPSPPEPAQALGA
jgi:PAT family beta-lactamase induction signal transducer AmpG